MRSEYLRIAPDLDILVKWSPRMDEFFHKQYEPVIHAFAERHQQAPASAYLRQEYDRWCRVQEAAFFQIKRFFTLTKSLPSVGDELMQGSRDGGALRIEKRIIFSMPDEDSLLVVYEMCSEELDALEEYEASALLEEQD